ncbi:UNVERIFIED_CONTAM: Transposon TX1 uncharacterized protein [Sesamum radiatum]|uniref:Transposon TX1 uncharacterized protein n=1 Tax=Sesamum radiatum TaxID=300843 RepID=A0AAW2JF27_SESRA
MFRFDNYIALSPGFIASVQGIWRHHIVGTPMYSVTRKLKALKPIFRQQRKMKGDLSANVKLAGEFLEVFLPPRKIVMTLAVAFGALLQTCVPKGCLRSNRRANKRIFQISDEAGNTFMEPNEISNVFVAYYQRLLGGAVFDIEEDRAPGPDGYSSGFFKAAWPVVGEEITAAVMDFLLRSSLLKQVNATLITLIPKVSAPSLVADFRPISCCNVIYKIITKILVIRIRGILDKLISPSQTAFVPGRSISDNVLLAQELFSGYKQCRLPPRCALKVDLRKAYDTVEWDFLMATLQLFGFPSTFNRWIEECVTSPHFSLYLNGEMVVLHTTGRCKELGLFQLSFADDLILLCKAEVRSVDLFRRGLELFASLSGLHTNPQKSHLILSKAANGVRTSLLETLGFQEGRLPLRYLGLPLIASRLTMLDCQPLLQKIDARIRGWDGVGLSFAGRVQLIKSVLLAFEVYWAMAFLLPKGVIKEIVKRIRTFLWKGNSSSGYPKVAWESVCKPIEEGGQGMRDILALNRALMSRHLWSIIKHEKESIWVEWITHYRLRDASIWDGKCKERSLELAEDA